MSANSPSAPVSSAAEDGRGLRAVVAEIWRVLTKTLPPGVEEPDWEQLKNLAGDCVVPVYATLKAHTELPWAYLMAELPPDVDAEGVNVALNILVSKGLVRTHQRGDRGRVTTYELLPQLRP